MSNIKSLYQVAMEKVAIPPEISGIVAQLYRLQVYNTTWLPNMYDIYNTL